MTSLGGATATFTPGGLESIFLALKTARDWARAEKGIVAPEAVVPRTCHPTFSRAAQYLGIEIIRVPRWPAWPSASMRTRSC